MNLDKPTLHEINFIIDKRVKLRILHPRLFRKLNDIRGSCVEEKDRILNAFSKWAYNKYGMTSFECLMYYNYIMCMIDYNSPVFYPITDMIDTEGYIGNSSTDENRFIDRFDSVRWLIASRLTKSTLQSNMVNVV